MIQSVSEQQALFLAMNILSDLIFFFFNKIIRGIYISNNFQVRSNDFFLNTISPNAENNGIFLNFLRKIDF